jgi:hypothetical protein
MSVGPARDRQRELTVAHVRDRPDMDFVEVMFLQSARIFHLSRSHERFQQLLSRLQQAETSGRAANVTFTAPNGGDIEDVEGS